MTCRALLISSSLFLVLGLGACGEDPGGSTTTTGTGEGTDPGGTGTDPGATGTDPGGTGTDPGGTGPTCSDECSTVGAKQCDGDGTQTCGDLDADGCLEWGATQACGAGETCSGGQCAIGCANECTTSGAKQCGEKGFETCGDHDSDACLEWGAPTACPEGQICSGGVCAVDCKSECSTKGAKQCQGAGFQACGEFDEDECLEWGSVQPCAAGQTCSGGSCAVGCEDECTTSGAKQCSGNATQECGNWDGDSCLEWGTPVACGDGQSCSAGACKVGCEDECSATGAKKCQGDGVQTCGNSDEDPCLEWSTAVACPGEQTCSSGACAETCSDECSASGAKKCEGTAKVECGAFDSDPCLEWGTPTPCGEGETCTGGQCQVGCVDECTVKNAKVCEGAGTKICDDYNGDGCLSWGSVEPCGPAQTCSAGHCANTCVDECSVSGGTGCGAFGVTTCGDFDGDSCLEWGIEEACFPGEACSGGECVFIDDCFDECFDVGESFCDELGFVLECGDWDEDACLEYGTALFCDFGQECIAGECVDQIGFGTCAEINDCISICGEDGECANDCFFLGSIEAQDAFQSLSDCGAYYGCEDDFCYSVFCEEPIAQCFFEAGVGSGGCADIYQCAIDCGDDGFCAESCPGLGTLQAQGDWAQFVVCANLVCPIGSDPGCLDVAIAVDAPCGPANYQCIDPLGSDGGTCYAALDCASLCAEDDTFCVDDCLAATSLLGTAEFLALSQCIELNGCVDGSCIAFTCGYEFAECWAFFDGDQTCPEVADAINLCPDSDADCISIALDSGNHAAQQAYLGLALCLNDFCPFGDEDGCYADAEQSFCADWVSFCQFN